MSKHTEGKLKAEPFPGTVNDPTWIVQAENGEIIFQTISDNDEANAKELVHRWENFENLLTMCGGNQAFFQQMRNLFDSSNPAHKSMLEVLDGIDEVNEKVIADAETRE